MACLPTLAVVGVRRSQNGQIGPADLVRLTRAALLRVRRPDGRTASVDLLAPAGN